MNIYQITNAQQPTSTMLVAAFNSSHAITLHDEYHGESKHVYAITCMGELLLPVKAGVLSIKTS